KNRQDIISDKERILLGLNVESNKPHVEKEQNKLISATMEFSYNKPVVLTTDYENKRLASSKYFSERKRVQSSRRKHDRDKAVSIKKSSTDRRLKRPNDTVRESKHHYGSKSSWVKQRISRNK
ncbi:10754_t:CDS:2, partial [Dentiscutata erythropus]